VRPEGRYVSAKEADKVYFGKAPEEPSLDDDGLPFVGDMIQKGDPYYSVVREPAAPKIKNYKSQEPAYIDNVTCLGGLSGVTERLRLQKVSIRLRYNRNPVIGDKFSSRHGQKGVLSQLWPEIDMPFSESGMKPDCIINPNAFPSRMTIGMLVESMAGKAGAQHGFYQDASPFQFNEKNTAVDYFGQQLIKAGYNYYGNEPMYSGIMGTEFHADIYLGVVYYQRLRHMVKDKYQARSHGPINKLTHQPVKGRKLGGGIRFGEMERDSLLAHGASFLLLDRLMNCSDYSRVHACKDCGSILSPTNHQSAHTRDRYMKCRMCNSKKGIEEISLPYVFRFLVAELAAVNIKVTLNIGEK